MGLAYINEDAWCACANRSGPPFNSPFPAVVDEAGIGRLVDYYAVPGVTGVMFNANAMRAFFDSRVFEPLWSGLEETPDGKAYFEGRELVHPQNGVEDWLTLCRNLRALFAKVPDPFRVRYGHCRKRGIECWISMRMNDVHYVDDPGLIAHAALWRDHPEYRRATFKKDYSFWFSQCLDYGRAEVREHHLALVREYLDRFDMDGLELDWMRSPFHFRPGFAERSAGLLTDFMREARRLVVLAAERRGRPPRLAVRVPSRIEEALYGGMDVFTWAREGLVDLVVPSPYFQSSESGLPVGLWRRILPEKTLLLPCLEQHVGHDGHTWMKADIAIDAGFASAYYYQGADGIYLFNHQYRDGLSDVVAQQRLYGLVGDRDRLERSPRRHVATPHESTVEGIPSLPAFAQRVEPKGTVSVRLPLGGQVSDRQAVLWLAFTESPCSEVRVWLNGGRCVPISGESAPAMPPELSAPIGFSVMPGAAHDGENVIDISNIGESPLTLRWVELGLSMLNTAFQ